jgi:hypothetical protein
VFSLLRTGGLATHYVKFKFITLQYTEMITSYFFFVIIFSFTKTSAFFVHGFHIMDIVSALELVRYAETFFT